MRYLKFGSILLLIAAFAPFVLAAFFVYPLGYHEIDWLMGYTEKRAGIDFWGLQNYFYKEQGGRFTSTFLLGTLPYWYNLTAFRVVVASALVLYFSSFWYLLRSLLQDKLVTWLAVATIWPVYLHQLTNCYDSLLRFTCLSIYQLGFSGVALVIILFLRMQQNPESRWNKLLLALVLLFTCGTIELTIVYLLLLTFGLFIYQYKQEFINAKNYAWPLLFLGLGMALALLAPGNFARQDLYESGRSLMELLGLIIGTSLFLWIDWLTDTLLLPSIILLIGFIHAYHLPLRLPLKISWYVLGTIMVVPCALIPVIVATEGNSLPERVVDQLFLVFALGLMLTSLIYYQKYRLSWSLKGKLPSWAMLALGVFLLGQLFFSGLDIDRSKKNYTNPLEIIQVSSNIGYAYWQFFNNIPQQYSADMQRVEKEILNCTESNCLVSPLRTPEFIGYDLIYDRMNKGGEIGMARYLGNRISTVKYRIVDE